MKSAAVWVIARVKQKISPHHAIVTLTVFCYFVRSECWRIDVSEASDGSDISLHIAVYDCHPEKHRTMTAQM